MWDILPKHRTQVDGDILTRYGTLVDGILRSAATYTYVSTGASGLIKCLTWPEQEQYIDTIQYCTVQYSTIE